MEKFKPILQGTWVKNDYINSIEKTHSPYQSFSKLKNVASIIIDMKSATADSVVAGISLNNHEGSEFTILFRQGYRPACLQTTLEAKLYDFDNGNSFYELGYNVINADTSLVLYHFSKSKVLLDTVSYTRVMMAASDPDAGSGIDYITNKKLFTGTYTITDSTGHKTYVQFDNEGNVYNFLDFKKYGANTDFEAGPANNIDQMYFDVYTKKQKEYTYKLGSDTLSLYTINYSPDSMVQSRVKLRYKLVKQK